MEIRIPEKTLSICETADVLVVGGGPAGIGAAVSAARQGAKVILLEKRGFFGGNITACYVENCNYFMRGTPFDASGVYHEIERKYTQRYGTSDDLRPGSRRFSSEYLKIFLDDFIRRERISVKLHSFVNDVVMNGDVIDCVIIQTKKGPVAVKAGIVIDATGDADVAYSAGVPFEQGRELDGLCQPGSVNFRIVGVDVEKFIQPGAFKKLEEDFRADYLSGDSGLSCKRKDLPIGRLTAASQISYLNYSCEYRIDPTDIDDLTRGEMECRRYISELFDYLKKKVDGMQKIEISSIAPEIGFRDSRRIKALYRLTMEDVESQREFDDTITTYPRFYDMLAPDGDMSGDGSLEGKGYKGHIFVPIEGERIYHIPYRSMLPVNVRNLIVAGRCISSDHVAQSTLRAISACMMTGQAAGTAAAMATDAKTGPKDVDVHRLRNSLKQQGMIL